jgi:hypothetical protein
LVLLCRLLWLLLLLLLLLLLVVVMIWSLLLYTCRVLFFLLWLLLLLRVVVLLLLLLLLLKRDYLLGCIPRALPSKRTEIMVTTTLSILLIRPGGRESLIAPHGHGLRRLV